MAQTSLHSLHRRARLVAGALLFLACGPVADTSTGSSASDGTTTGASESGTSGSSGTQSSTSSEPTTADEPGTSAATSGTVTGTTGDLPPGVECLQDADCQVVEDCCTCDARPIGEPFDTCQLACDVTACDLAFELEVAAACRGGRCEFTSGACTGTPACDEPPPECESGTIPAIDGDCWGECVAPLACAGTCAGEGAACGVGWACVESQSSSPVCHPVPLACEGVPTCECMPDEVCMFGPCSDDGGGLLCEDGG